MADNTPGFKIFLTGQDIDHLNTSKGFILYSCSSQSSLACLAFKTPYMSSESSAFCPLFTACRTNVGLSMFSCWQQCESVSECGTAIWQGVFTTNGGSSTSILCDIIKGRLKANRKGNGFFSNGVLGWSYETIGGLPLRQAGDTLFYY